MSSTNYPRLLPAPMWAPGHPAALVPVATCTNHLLPADLLIELSNRLRARFHTTTKEFIALCEYNINPEFEAHVRDMTGSDLRTASTLATIGIKRWQARRSPAPESKPDAATIGEPGSPRNGHRKTYRSSTAAKGASSTAAKGASIRDQRRCLITLKDDLIEVAHLVPLSTYDNSNDHHRSQPAFITLLRMFAGEDTTQKVMNYLGLTLSSPPTPTNEKPTNRKPSPAAQKLINRMENLLTLPTETHRYWDTGKIILEPVGDPLSIFTTNPDALLTHYDVRFSFVPGHRQPSGTGWDETTLVQVSTIPSLQFSEDDDPGLHNIFLTRLTEPTPALASQQPPATVGNRPSRGVGRFKELETGTIIRLTTMDPQKYPLPHPDLLRLHAALSRVVRCAAAAEPQFWDFEDDDEADVSEVGEGDEADVSDMGLEDVAVEEDRNLLDSPNHNRRSTLQTPVDPDDEFSTNAVPGSEEMEEMTLPGSVSLDQAARVWEFLNGLPSPPPSSPVCGLLHRPAGDTVRNSANPPEIEAGRKRGHVEDEVAGKRMDERVYGGRSDYRLWQRT